MIDSNDTIAAIATPPGRGGIGVIRISGPQALDIGASLVGEKPSARQARYCRFRDSNGTTLDKGLVLYFAAPASYTGEDVVELQGHGGQAVLDLILKQTLFLGARLARPGEFTERAFLNDKLDLLQAEAIADLIDSASEQAARSAMRSLEGEFSVNVETLLRELRAMRVFIEGALDFPEEEIDFLSSSDIEQRAIDNLKNLDTLLKKARNVSVLRDGLSVVIMGAPNVGKSSLLNVLSQTNRAIVMPSPGTTRDLIEEHILLDGVPLHIVDTAGIRDTEDYVEQEGIRRAQLAAEKADLILLVLEAKPANQRTDRELEKRMPVGAKRIVIHNKIDLVNIQAKTEKKLNDSPEIYLSVKTGEGLNLLTDQIKQEMGIADKTEDVLSARTRHIDALLHARALMDKVLLQLKGKKPAAELIAEDLQQAQLCLEMITGKSTSDDLLGEIFSRFCIGK